MPSPNSSKNNSTSIATDTTEAHQAAPPPGIPSDIEAKVCLRRKEGQVCICETCEATRTRMIHRLSASSRKKRKFAGVDEVDDVVVAADPPAREEQPQQAAAAGVAAPSGGDVIEDTSSSMSTNASAAGADDDVDAKKKPSAAAASGAAAPAAATTTQLAAVAAGKGKCCGCGGKSEDKDAQRLATMSSACRTILECIGENPDREGLVKTPERWAKALMYMCSGYSMTPEQVTNGAVFEENHDEMVVVRNIDIYSLCEHHMVPFAGRVHIGYIPNGRILGLSKLARIAELYARRLQVQERLTRQIADAVVETVEPLGVAVVVECTHMCMVMRGVQKSGSVTTTSSVRGCFESNPKTRAEFFSIIHGSGVKMC